MKSVTTGQTKDLIVTVRNSGNAALAASGLSSNNASFTVVSPAAAFSVAAGATQAVTPRFAPSIAASVSGAVTIASNDPAQAALTVPVFGVGVAPVVPVPPANLAGQWSTDFGPMTLTQAGGSISGTYPNCSGTITRTVAASVLSGNWTHRGSGGTLSFTMAVEGNRFTGTSTRVTGMNGGGPWNGVRAVAQAPAPVLKLRRRPWTLGL